MSRSVSADLYNAILAQETDKALFVLIEIDHADLDEPIRIVNNTESVTSNGVTYQPYWFTIAFPAEENGRLKEAKLVMDNTDRQIVEAVRSISTSPTVSLKVVLSSSPDTVEIALTGMTLKNVAYDASTVSGELVYEERVLRQIPGLYITPEDFPGAYK